MNRKSMVFRILVWLLFLVGGAAAGVLWDLSCCSRLFLNPYEHLVTLIIGIWLFRLVMHASRNTGRYLAKFGKQGAIPKFETNQLVTTGYYACMRHPMHFGLLFFPLAWAFITGSVTFILIIAPIEMILMILMIKFLEEKEALQKFGKAYVEYKTKTPFLSLKKDCLQSLFSKHGLNTND